MPTRAQALIALVALTATASLAAPKPAPKAAAKPGLPRCEFKINQPAASVRLNRTKAPPSVCVLGCDARLVGVRRENGQIAALAIYTGRRCLPAGSSKGKPPAADKSPATPPAHSPPLTTAKLEGKPGAQSAPTPESKAVPAKPDSKPAPKTAATPAPAPKSRPLAASGPTPALAPAPAAVASVESPPRKAAKPGTPAAPRPARP